MSKTAKSKLKWVLYTGEMFDVYLVPELIKRVHAPIEPDLEYVPALHCKCLHLHPCAVGLDKDGAIAAYLYCTNSGRFFDHGKNGWGEHKYVFNPAMQNYKRGSKQPCMRNFGCLLCHLLVAHAWIGPRPEGMVCDHLDTNLLNLCADNFEWVTVPENIRRAKIARRMRKIGLNPKRLTRALLRRIYALQQARIDMFLEYFKLCCVADDSDLSIENIRQNVATALDAIKGQITV